MHDAEASIGAAAPVEGAAATKGLAVYYLLLATQAVSLIGSQVSQYAVGIAVYRATGHATPVALVAFFSTAPAIVFAGIGGALADRFDRRGMMLISNVGYVVVSGLLLISFASGAFQLWHLYALTVGAALFAAIERPAFSASIAMLVPNSHRDRANAIGQLTAPTAGVIAPALAGVLFAAIGVVGSIASAIVTFSVALCVLSIVRIPRPAVTTDKVGQRTSLLSRAFDGFRYLAARPTLFGFCGYVSVVNFVANIALVLLTPYVLARTGSTQAFGVVLGVMNAGGIAGGLVIGAGLRIGSRMNTVMLATIISALFLCLAGAARSPPPIGASLFGMFFSLAFVNAPFSSILQSKIAPDLQGRVFAAIFQMAMVMAPLAALVTGPLADGVFEPARRQSAWRGVSWLVGSGPGAGMGLMFVGAGVLILALSSAVYSIPTMRRLEIDLPDHERAGA